MSCEQIGTQVPKFLLRHQVIKMAYQGFTLIEMLIAIVIMGTAISMVTVSVAQSVRSQEKMQDLLDIYQVSLTASHQIAEKVKQDELTGSYVIGDITVRWQAELAEQKDEAPILQVDIATFSTPRFTLNYYIVSVFLESPYSRRTYQFEQMVERDKRFPNR